MTEKGVQTNIDLNNNFLRPEKMTFSKTWRNISKYDIVIKFTGKELFLINPMIEFKTYNKGELNG